MKLHRFYTTISIEEGVINTLPDQSLIHQIGSVLRLCPDDRVVFWNGNGNDYESKIVLIDKNKITFRVVNIKIVKPFFSLKLFLAFSLIKKDNIEWIIQKCSELGVTNFIPLISERSEKKGFNLERAKKIMIEACEQSGRGDVPVIHEPVSLREFLQKENKKIIVFHTHGNGLDKNNFLSETELVACIGPEGGWSETEISLLKEKGVSIVRLNTPILRSETAAVVISSIFLAK